MSGGDGAARRRATNEITTIANPGEHSWLCATATMHRGAQALAVHLDYGVVHAVGHERIGLVERSQPLQENE